MKNIKKIIFSILGLVILGTSVLLLGACNESKFINVTLDYTPNGCCFQATPSIISANEEPHYTAFYAYFSDNYDEIPTTFKFKSGEQVDVAPFTTIHRGYKVDKIYYLDKSNQEVVLYAYTEGDYTSEWGFINDTWSANRKYNQWEQYFTLPNYDITIHIVSSSF